MSDPRFDDMMKATRLTQAGTSGGGDHAAAKIVGCGMANPRVLIRRPRG